MSTGGPPVTEQELLELRKKFHLLEGDRKAYYEMSMHTMKENKKVMAQLRCDIKELRKQLAHIQREASSAQKAGMTPDQEEVADLDRQVTNMRKICDTLRHQAHQKQSVLQRLRDQAAELELEAQRPSAEDSPLTRKIRMLENRLDKAMIKYNEAQSIRKTYEQIVKRLKEERVGFDNQLQALERTLAAKQHDYEELLLLSGDANHAKEVALQELERVRHQQREERAMRERELKDRQELVNLKTDMAQRMENREKMRQDIIAQAAGDLGTQEEENLKKSLAVNKITQSKIQEDSKEHRRKIDVYESAFRKIKEATGVSDVNEVIQKIVSQEDTQNNLMELTRENQAKIEAMNEEKARLKSRVEEIKYSGPGGGHRRKMVDDHEENLTQSAAKLERCRLKYERLAKILINVKAGIEHLSEKLESVREDGKQARAPPPHCSNALRLFCAFCLVLQHCNLSRASLTVMISPSHVCTDRNE